MSRILLLPDTRDPENMGALIRSAAAFSFDALFLGPGSCDPLSRRALRVSMGAVLSLPIVRLTGAEDLARLKAEGISVVAAVLDPEAVPARAWSPAARFALAIGNEFSGLAPEWKARADLLVRIPMAPGPDSLNASAAGAILMYEASAERPSASGGAPFRGPAGEACAKPAGGVS